MFYMHTRVCADALVVTKSQPLVLSLRHSGTVHLLKDYYDVIFEAGTFADPPPPPNSWSSLIWLASKLQGTLPVSASPTLRIISVPLYPAV